MFNIIKEVIVKWDPIYLMGFAPKDEYDYECQLILDRFVKGQEILGEIIYEVFRESFGEEFRIDISKCMEIAEEMEGRIGKQCRNY